MGLRVRTRGCWIPEGVGTLLILSLEEPQPGRGQSGAFRGGARLGMPGTGQVDAFRGWDGARNRIEHVQLLNSRHPRLVELNIVASMQPSVPPGLPWLIGTGRLPCWAYPSKASQARYSPAWPDAPVEEADVLKGMYSAVAQCWDEPETEPWYGGKAVSMWDALRAFTMVEFTPWQKGLSRVLAQSAADFTVLTQDILAGSPDSQGNSCCSNVRGGNVYER